MRLQRKTKLVDCGPLRGEVSIAAAAYAMVGHQGDRVGLRDARHVIEGRPFPDLALIVKGVGTIHLSPAEVRGLLQTIEDCVTASASPGNYVKARTCSKAL